MAIARRVLRPDAELRHRRRHGHLGLDAAYRERTHCTLYTLELHIHYLHEIKSSDELRIVTSVLDCDRKRIHAACDFLCPRIDGPAAIADLMLLHVQQGAKPASASFPAEVSQRLEALKLTPEALAERGLGSRKIELNGADDYRERAAAGHHDG